jgi:hypothetical protein
MKAKILVLNDLHVGSATGLLPPDFMDTQGNPCLQNKAQKYLWECFTTALKEIQPQDIDHIVINGDILDGNPGKGATAGYDCTLDRIPDQMEAAIKVLEEVKNTFPKAGWDFVYGTPNHESPANVNIVVERLFGRMNTPRCQQTLKLKVGDAIIQFHHETSFASGFMRSNSLEREQIRGWLAEAENGWVNADCEIRSHCHYFAATVRSSHLAIVTPCWQMQNAYCTKNSPNKMIPVLGCVVLSVDDSLKKYGRCPVGFTEYTYSHPQPAIVNISEEVGNGTLTTNSL